MGLPPALQERLLKRGLLQNKAKQPEEAEEVFAESYDDPNDTTKSKASFDLDKVPDCPNRLNRFHDCTDYCGQKYGYKKFQPHPVFEKRRLRMLKIYPLLPNWLEVPDIYTNRYYYWNTESNQVSWLSPSCPKAKFEYSKKIDKVSNNESEKARQQQLASSGSSQKSLHDNVDKFVSELDKFSKPKQQSSSANKKARTSGGLDPMDPSSYSDVPRGKWSAGLDGGD